MTEQHVSNRINSILHRQSLMGSERARLESELKALQGQVFWVKLNVPIFVVVLPILVYLLRKNSTQDVLAIVGALFLMRELIVLAWLATKIRKAKKQLQGWKEIIEEVAETTSYKDKLD